MSSSFGYAAMLTSMSGAVLFWYLSFLWRTWSPVTGLCVLGNWKKNASDWAYITCDLKRRDRDSNPGYIAVRLFSRQVQSTTLPSLQYVCLSPYDGAKLALFVHSCKNADTHCAKKCYWKATSIYLFGVTLHRPSAYFQIVNIIHVRVFNLISMGSARPFCPVHRHV